MLESSTILPLPEAHPFRDAFNNSPIGVAVEDLDGQPLFVNPAFCTFLGFTEEELRRKHCADFSPAEDAEKDWALFQELKAGLIDNYQLDKRYFRRDGTLVWGRLSISLLNGRPSPLVLAMVEDITERKRAEEALRESESKFRSVFRDTGVCKVMVSPEGRFLAANKAFCDTLGYSEDELLEKTVESITYPEDWPAFADKLRDALTEKCGFQWVEKRCLHKSGRIVHTENTTSLILSREGNPQCFVGEVLDITKRKQAEEALSSMTRRLIETQEQERTRIGRELHDDINQRLALLAVDVAQLQENPADVHSRAQTIRERMDEISSDIQALSHELHSSKLHYLGVLGGMKSWCKDFAERQRIQLDFRGDVSSPIPYEVGLSLFRVLQEAVHNSVKHSGVRRIEIEIRQDTSATHLVIRDSGKGFDVEAAMNGNGLGLTSMKERVRLINGTISIESEPLHGAAIHVRVPRTSGHDSEKVSV